MKSSLLPIDVKDDIVSIIRCMEVLTSLLESAAESPCELAPATSAEAAHMVREEILKLRQLLQLNVL